MTTRSRNSRRCFSSNRFGWTNAPYPSVPTTDTTPVPTSRVHPTPTRWGSTTGLPGTASSSIWYDEDPTTRWTTHHGRRTTRTRVRPSDGDSDHVGPWTDIIRDRSGRTSNTWSTRYGWIWRSPRLVLEKGRIPFGPKRGGTSSTRIPGQLERVDSVPCGVRDPVNP